MVSNDENILVELDYQNVVLVDPNKTISAEGDIKDRLLKHENLVYYANLEATMIPRTRFAVGANGNFQAETISIASLNFMKPGGKDFLTEEYTDEFTGLNSLDKNGTNQIIEKPQSIQKKDGSIEKYVSQQIINNVDTQLLGITSINVSIGLGGFPEVSIEMDDVRGRALFEKGENSPYAVFFNYPYPLFYLTLKGYLGKAIKYQLTLRTFNARYDYNSGNFKISVKFMAFKYNILTAVGMKYLYSLPFMYSKTYTISPSNDLGSQSAQNTNGNDKGDVKKIPSSRGIQKIKEVYSAYKSKGLIEQDFPEITIQELVAKLSNFEQMIEASFPEADLTPITDGENYRQTIREFQGDVLFYVGESWVEKYMDRQNFYYEGKSGNNLKIYTFKKEILQVEDNRNVAIEELKNIVKQSTKELKDNPTFGSIDPNISYETFTFKPSLLIDDIDIKKTFIDRFNRTPEEAPVDFENFKKSLVTIFANFPQSNGVSDSYWFFFEGENSFERQIQTIENQLNTKLKKIEDDLTKKLTERLNDKKNGLGFKPTIKNIIAVLLANAEGFIRMMCEVHELAWDKRRDKDRRNATLSTSKTVQSVDTKDDYQITDDEIIPVYPWPQFFVESSVESGEKYELAYPGDPKYASQTKSYLSEKWPEVEFVEEFLKGRIKVAEGTIPFIDQGNEGQIINRISLATIDFPTENIILSDKQESKYMFEIYERILLYSFYQRFVGQIYSNEVFDLLSESETINVINSLGEDTPSLIFKLKNFNFNSENYLRLLAGMSNNGLGESWQKYIRTIFVTDYIQNEVENSFVIYPKEIFNAGVNVVQPEPEQLKKLESVLTTTRTNQFTFLDLFPFNIKGWFSENLANGKGTSQTEIMNTSKVLVVNSDKKMLSNFDVSTSKTQKRPITNFNFYQPTKPNPNQFDLKQFYENRLKDKNLINQQITEGSVFYKNYNNFLSEVQTTSMLNTPIFINSIMEGVKNAIKSDPYPYTSAAYVFLNSLPLATLREKYKTLNGSVTEDLDYIFSCFTKLGALHTVPYAWVLKYGSIWHRYKKWKEEGKDILDESWKNFDYVSSFDPATKNPNKEYNLFVNNLNQQLFLQKINSVGGTATSQMNVGFYPEVVNFFNFFCKGTSLFSGYTDNEIQSKLNTGSGFTLNYSDSSSFVGDDGTGLLVKNNNLRFRTWSCTLEGNDGNFVVPSFGSNINQVKSECFDRNNKLKIPVLNNPAVYNGSVRSFWALPNYGYFDLDKVDKPNPNRYFKSIFTNQSEQESFSFADQEDYTLLEDIFGVFDRKILDILETEFLEFSKSIYSYRTDEVEDQNGRTVIYKTQFETIPNDNNIQFKNFQYLIRSILKIEKPTSIDSKGLIQEVEKSQFDNVISVLKSFMEFDVVLKHGNPGFYNRRLFDSYSTVQFVEDRISYNPYILGSLPTKNGTTTLQQSRNNNPEGWAALETYVGFSNEESMEYSDQGSYITDFFVDMNIEFIKESVQELYPLIKIYATQKKNDPTLNRLKFISQIDQYITQLNTQTNTILDLTLQKLRKRLPNISESQEKKPTKVIEGEQTPLELWETFKALNDTWIAGYDYTQTTFFEDVLLLDRANRNLGDQIYIDPFKVKSLFTNINEAASVYFYLESLLTIHNFVCMMHPGFVNYYNVQEVQKNNVPSSDSTLEFGNNLFGTFLNVDFRNSSPKLVCTYAAEPSSMLDMDKNVNVRFRSDTFDLSRASGMPLLDRLEGKTDWGLSNKVVGFNVDIGIRNQNIFSNLDINQDLGKQTAESLTQLDNTINQANGRNLTTQNVSLWNFYKKRSYQCTVNSLGNALIQPTMYFNLRYVPMFSGPYYITEVRHSISPGNFITTFTGIRQQIFALPKLDAYTQTIIKTIYSGIIERLKQQVNTEKSDQPDQNATKLDPPVVTNVALPANCEKTLSNNFVKKYPSNTSLDNPDIIRKSLTEVAKEIKQYISGTTNDTSARMISFVTICINSFNGADFVYWNNNFSGVKLTKTSEYPDPLMGLVSNKFICTSNSIGEYEAIAVFDNVENMYKFLLERWGNLARFIDTTPESLLKYWFDYWNANRGGTGAFDTWKNGNLTEYDSYIEQIKDIIELAKKPEVGLLS